MPLITWNVTESERQALRNLADGNVSEYLRCIIKQDAKRRGLVWPDQTHDTRRDHWRGKQHQCPQCNGWNVGEIDSVKACADCGYNGD